MRRECGNVFPTRRFQSKLLVSDPGMHHGTCATHVPWCMSGSLSCGGGENVPGIPGACAPVILRIWQEAHWVLVIFSREETYISFHYRLSTFRCYKLFKSFAVEAKNERRCTRMAKHESQTMEQNIKSNKILQKWHSLFAIIAVQGHRDQWIKFKFK